MRTGVLMESRLVWLVSCVLSLSSVIHVCLAAPGLPGTQREESEDAHPPNLALPNPFGPGEEERKLLQSYIQSSLKNVQGGPEINSREQEVFFLFRMYDYDRSGFLDGLEMMKLLSDYNSYHAAGADASELVVSMVDFLLQTQDLNQDGLLDPSELLSPAFTLTQGSNNNSTPRQEQEVEVEKKQSNIIAEVEKAGAEEEGLEEVHPEDKEIPQQEVKTEEDEAINKINEQEITEVLSEGQEQLHGVPVHHGQPEI